MSAMSARSGPEAGDRLRFLCKPALALSFPLSTASTTTAAAVAVGTGFSARVLSAALAFAGVIDTATPVTAGDISLFALNTVAFPADNEDNEEATNDNWDSAEAMSLAKASNSLTALFKSRSSWGDIFSNGSSSTDCTPISFIASPAASLTSADA
jgi:hypothetical protein